MYSFPVKKNNWLFCYLSDFLTLINYFPANFLICFSLGSIFSSSWLSYVILLNLVNVKLDYDCIPLCLRMNNETLLLIRILWRSSFTAGIVWIVFPYTLFLTSMGGIFSSFGGGAGMILLAMVFLGLRLLLP